MERAKTAAGQITLWHCLTAGLFAGIAMWQLLTGYSLTAFEGATFRAALAMTGLLAGWIMYPTAVKITNTGKGDALDLLKGGLCIAALIAIGESPKWIYPVHWN